MFNSYQGGNVNNTLKINAVSGGIYKTYKESWFKRFHLNSVLSDKLFRKENCFYNVAIDEYGINPDKLGDKTNIHKVIILQMILCGDMEVIAEIICKDDLEKYIGNFN